MFILQGQTVGKSLFLSGGSQEMLCSWRPLSLACEDFPSQNHIHTAQVKNRICHGIEKIRHSSENMPPQKAV